MATADQLLAVGLSHHTAPVAVRERLALDEDGVRRHLGRLMSEGVCSEAMMLSTCNRVELYTVPSNADRLRSYMDEFRGPGGESVQRYLYWHRGPFAVEHLFRVASSLDSQVVGEPQILGQVKDAVRIAQESKTLGRLLHPLVDRSLSVAKRVRTQTSIGQHRVGIGNAGVDLAVHMFGDLSGKRALLVGVGEMGQQVARALLTAGLEELLVTNRTAERAQQAAAEHGGTAIPWDRLGDYLSRVDVVIAATGARTPIIDYRMVKTALRARRYRTILLVDLSVPRNIHPNVDDLDEAFLFNVDDLSRVIEEGKKAREAASEQALALVREEVDRFVRTLSEVDVGPRIGAITARAEQARVDELQRSKRLVDSLTPEQIEQLDKLTRSLVKKVLHGPLRGLRSAAREGDEQAVDAIAALWEDE